MSEETPQTPAYKSLDEILSSEEKEAFYDHSSERALGIILGAIVENHLTNVLRLLMRRDKALAEELFKSTGPLGPFGTKVRLAYMLRIIAEETYKDLLYVNRIRNKFAHDLRITSFEDQQISAWIFNMHTFSIIKSLGEEASERLDAGNSEKSTSDVVRSFALLSAKDAYRDCVRLLIHHITEIEFSIIDGEATLNANEKGENASSCQKS